MSAGARKDLLVLFFAKAIFQTALEIETVGSTPRERSNKAYRINNQIDRRIKIFNGTNNGYNNIQTLNCILAMWIY